ncbi:MAG: hypothetical protein NVSMB52_05470 [Chloroflexota bacterium]
MPWGLPTGFMEPREQPADALSREIREEAGFSVNLAPVWKTYTDSHRPLVNIVFRGTSPGGNFRPSLEISEARFAPVTDLPAMLPDQRRLIEECAREDQRENHT